MTYSIRVKQDFVRLYLCLVLNIECDYAIPVFLYVTVVDTTTRAAKN